MNLIYCETPELEKAICLGIEEFAYYRKHHGYSSTDENNKLADDIIKSWDEDQDTYDGGGVTKL
jgi:hypothetical protein